MHHLLRQAIPRNVCGCWTAGAPRHPSEGACNLQTWLRLRCNGDSRPWRLPAASAPWMERELCLTYAPDGISSVGPWTTGKKCCRESASFAILSLKEDEEVKIQRTAHCLQAVGSIRAEDGHARSSSVGVPPNSRQGDKRLVEFFDETTKSVVYPDASPHPRHPRHLGAHYLTLVPPSYLRRRYSISTHTTTNLQQIRSLHEKLFQNRLAYQYG